jgi:hypothetical protein
MGCDLQVIKGPNFFRHQPPTGHYKHFAKEWAHLVAPAKVKVKLYLSSMV